MKRLQAFKFELMPTGAQQSNLRRIAGTCRFVFNKAPALQNDCFKRREKKPGYAALCKLLTQWKAEPEHEWLSETPSQALQQTLRDLERAWDNFFSKRASHPWYRKRGQRERFRYPQGVKLEQQNSQIFLPKIGWMRYRNSRLVEGAIKNVTLSQRANRWYASLQTAREMEAPLPTAATSIGIDMGIKRFATFSDGYHRDGSNSAASWNTSWHGMVVN